MRLILLRLCRSEKGDSDDDGGELIGEIWMAREARGKAAKSLAGVWQRVDGQMMMIPAALGKSVEDLPGDMSYVLIEDSAWKIRRRQ